MSSEDVRGRIGRTVLGLIKKGVLSPALAHLLDDEEITERYLVTLTTDYDGQEDEFEWEVVNTLGEARELVEAHLFFQEPAVGYVHFARVHDLREARELCYDIVQEIRWKEAARDDQ